MRPKFNWRLRSRSLMLGERTLIMGVVNVTPDSFSDGGQFLDPERALEHALKLVEEGADILDIGGESTRPGRKDRVSSEEEKRRILPVIDAILKKAPAVIISVDTYKRQTAEAALAAGAEIVNDVSGFTWDENMLGILAQRECGCVLMHTRGRPEQWKAQPLLPMDEILPLVLNGLHDLSQRALSSGIARERIVLDPGFGFGKRLDENFPLLGHLSELRRLGFPLLTGTSRKSFVAKLLPPDSSDRHSALLAGSVAALTASILAGAHIVRVHDVKASLAAARLADAVVDSASAPPNISVTSSFESEA
ncbi:MAG TPA: dihydropteroate synthase [Terriglobales bacterium]|nr:dihydropteroate synthase [Terriglobales bacterium]